MRRIQLTAPNGAKIEVRPDAINVMTPNAGDWDIKSNAVLRIDGENHAVRETMEEINKLEEDLDQKSR